MLDVLDPEVTVPITDTDMCLFEQSLRNVDVSPGLVIDLMRREQETIRELRGKPQISAAVVVFQEANSDDLDKFRKRYSNLLGTHETIRIEPEPEPETDIFQVWEEPKPSRLRRLWNWIWGKEDA